MNTSSPHTPPPAGVQHLIDVIRDAGAEGRQLRITGGNTRAFYGEPARGEPLPTSSVRGIVDYQPSELVVTARCGTRLDELEAELLAQGQHLAFEPPRFGADGTVGGMVASGLSGPGRMAGGAVREAVLGAVLLDGRGQIQRFGGQVIKNVAGYDVSRLLAGSLGRLGVILEVSLRVAPLPAATATRVFELPQGQAIERTHRWLAQAQPITASCWDHGRLVLRLQGAQAAVSRAERDLGGEAMVDDTADAFWQALRDHRHGVLQGPAHLPLWRLAVPPTHPPLALTGSPLVEWHGGQRWWRTDLPAEAIRAVARDAGGHATRFRAAAATAGDRRAATTDPDDDAAPAFTPLAQPMARIEAALYAAFDPHGILAPRANR